MQAIGPHCIEMHTAKEQRLKPINYCLPSVCIPNLHAHQSGPIKGVLHSSYIACFTTSTYSAILLEVIRKSNHSDIYPITHKRQDGIVSVFGSEVGTVQFITDCTSVHKSHITQTGSRSVFVNAHLMHHCLWQKVTVSSWCTDQLQVWRNCLLIGSVV